MLTFLQKHEDFRLPELNALLKMNGLEDPSVVYDLKDYRHDLPYLKIRLPSDKVAASVVDRGILIKSVMHLWGEGSTYEEAAAETMKLPSDVTAPHMAPDASWAVFVGAYGKSLSLDDQEASRRFFRHLDFKGPVKCANPDSIFWVLEEHAPGKDGLVPPDSAPSRIYFSREVCKSSGRGLVARCDLKKRAYLGPTSMDCELSLVMANMGLVRKGQLRESSRE